jgi:hypothetical protein
MGWLLRLNGVLPPFLEEIPAGVEAPLEPVADARGHTVREIAVRNVWWARSRQRQARDSGLHCGLLDRNPTGNEVWDTDGKPTADERDDYRGERQTYRQSYRFPATMTTPHARPIDLSGRGVDVRL